MGAADGIADLLFDLFFRFGKGVPEEADFTGSRMYQM